MINNLFKNRNLSDHSPENNYLSQYIRIMFLLFLYFFLGIVNYFDIMSGADLSLSSFNIFLIIVASWKFDKNTALFYAIVASSMEFILHICKGHSNIINLAINSGIYIIICLIICKLKKNFLKEKNLFKERFFDGNS